MSGDARESVPGKMLYRDAWGHLMLRRTGGADVAVRPVRSFPISHPEDGLALLGPLGRELVWIDHLADLPEDQRRLIIEDLAQREFNPEILHIRSASGWTTPTRWEIDTDRGPTHLTLNAEDDIRRLSPSALLIADACGVHFLLRDIAALDKTSRRILDHFL